MKKIFGFLLISLIIPEYLLSQGSQKITIDNNKASAEQINPEFQQIFPDFRSARIYYKAMRPIGCKANYNFLFDEILFLNEKGEKMALANPERLLHVIIDNRMFVPSNKGYFEVIESGDVSLLYKWVCRIRETRKQGALGLSTAAPSVYQMNRISFDSKEWKMEVDKEALASVEVIPYLKAKTNYISVKGPQSLMKAFRGKNSEIKDYLDKNPVDFKNEADLRRIIKYCNSL